MGAMKWLGLIQSRLSVTLCYLTLPESQGKDTHPGRQRTQESSWEGQSHKSYPRIGQGMVTGMRM